MIYSVAQYLIIFGFILAVWSAVSSFAGGFLRKRNLVESAERAVYMNFIMITASSFVLLYALITHEFSIKYVYQYTSSNLDPFYTATAFWAGQSGSLLFWAWLLTLFHAAVVMQNRDRNRQLMPFVTGTAGIVTAFFLLVLSFVTQPFERILPAPLEGSGLNPLLQNLGMIFHPPTLFVGFAGFTIPFAFVIAALIIGETDHRWVVTTRKWSIFSWSFLTIGIVLGMAWAYVELGWGGYWAWDPVENASYLPWIVATAYLHTIMAQEKRGMMKVWTASLIIASFALCIFGTFITRSGIISSVHSFGESAIGYYFFGFLVAVLALAFGLLIYRLPRLKSAHMLEDFISREGAYLLINLLLMGYFLAVFVGTTWPIYTELLQNKKVSVGPEFFNLVTTPIALAILFLLGLCPLISWRKASVKNFTKNLLIPSILGTVALIIFVTVFVMRLKNPDITGDMTFKKWVIFQLYVIFSFSFSVFTFTAILNEYIKSSLVHAKNTGMNMFASFMSLMRTNGRRYGGLMVHLGVVLVFIGITASSAFKTETEGALHTGESLKIGSYDLKFLQLKEEKINPEKTIVYAEVEVSKNGIKKGMLKPEVEFFTTWDQPSRNVDLRTGPMLDLYVTLVSWTADGHTATIQATINPLIQWIWIGGTLTVFGCIVAVLPKPARKRSR